MKEYLATEPQEDLLERMEAVGSLQVFRDRWGVEVFQGKGCKSLVKYVEGRTDKVLTPS